MVAIIVNKNDFDPLIVNLFRRKQGLVEDTDLGARVSQVRSPFTSSAASQSYYLSLTRPKMGITPTAP